MPEVILFSEWHKHRRTAVVPQACHGKYSTKKKKMNEHLSTLVSEVQYFLKPFLCPCSS